MVDQSLQVDLDQDVQNLKEDNDRLTEDMVKTRLKLDACNSALERQKTVSKTYHDSVISVKEMQVNLFQERFKAMIVLIVSLLIFQLNF